MVQKLIGRAEVEIINLEEEILARGDAAPAVLLDEWASRLNWLNIVGGSRRPNSQVAKICARKFDLQSGASAEAENFDPFLVTGRVRRPDEAR